VGGRERALSEPKAPRFAGNAAGGFATGRCDRIERLNIAKRHKTALRIDVANQFRLRLETWGFGVSGNREAASGLHDVR
jgi:hypothetical protein